MTKKVVQLLALFVLIFIILACYWMRKNISPSAIPSTLFEITKSFNSPKELINFCLFSIGISAAITIGLGSLSYLHIFKRLISVRRMGIVKATCVALLFLTLGIAATASILDIRNRAEWMKNIPGTNRFEKINLHKPVLIAHAGGAINGLTYTNTIEAMTDSLANDFIYYEIDILQSKDGQLFGGHDWEQFKKITNQNIPGKLTSSQVKDSVVFKKYHPVTNDFLRTFFEKNPSRFLVTDKIRNLRAVVQQFPFVDRMLVEVFSYEAYNKALSIGIKYPMICINSKRRLRRYLKKNLLRVNEVEMITTPMSLFRAEQATFKKLYKNGVSIFVYTANDANYIRTHMGKSATGFYTDYVRPADITQ